MRALVLLAACAVLVACAGDDGRNRAVRPSTTLPSTTVPAEPPHVVVLGDSNTAFAQADVESRLRAAGLEPTVLARAGYGLKDLAFWLGELPAVLADDPDVVLVALGTNDAVDTGDAAAFREHLDGMMRALGDRPVVWFAHHEDRPEPQGTNARTVNGAIRAAPERWPNLTVVDLAPLIAADPSLLDVDAVHFSDTGRPWFAEQLTTAAASATGAVSSRG